ncbi:MAG: PDZ domain-containing protein [Anaerolineae bacterium]
MFQNQVHDKAGLKDGDIILSVSGTTLDANTTEAQAAMLYLAGPVSSTVHIIIQRGTETLAFDVVRI